MGLLDLFNKDEDYTNYLKNPKQAWADLKERAEIVQQEVDKIEMAANLRIRQAEDSLDAFQQEAATKEEALQKNIDDLTEDKILLEKRVFSLEKENARLEGAETRLDRKYQSNMESERARLQTEYDRLEVDLHRRYKHQFDAKVATKEAQLESNFHDQMQQLILEQNDKSLNFIKDTIGSAVKESIVGFYNETRSGT